MSVDVGLKRYGPPIKLASLQQAIDRSVSRRSLVVTFNRDGVGGQAWAWFKGRNVWLLVETDGRWWPIGQEGVGGTVIRETEVAQLVARFGEPPTDAKVDCGCGRTYTWNEYLALDMPVKCRNGLASDRLDEEGMVWFFRDCTCKNTMLRAKP